MFHMSRSMTLCVRGVAGGCKTRSQADGSLIIASQLLGCDKDELRSALISRVMQPTRGGSKGTAIKYVQAQTYLTPYNRLSYLPKIRSPQKILNVKDIWKDYYRKKYILCREFVCFFSVCQSMNFLTLGQIYI